MKAIRKEKSFWFLFAVLGAMLMAIYTLDPASFDARAADLNPVNKTLNTVTEVKASVPNGDLNVFVKLAQKAMPSVVNLAITSGAEKMAPQAEIFKKHFEDFFGRPGPFGQGQGVMPKRQSLGSGVIIEVKDNKAIILTNHHVTSGASEIKVQFTKDLNAPDSVLGKVIAQDPDLDLALIQINVKSSWGVKALKFGDSDALQVGEYVMAVGNPFGQGHSVSHGIISAKGREAPIIGEYLQTDTPINPGNSGGPLLNLKGEIIGINNAILARAQGIGFAIPANSIQPVIKQLKENGKVERGYIGIFMAEVSPEAAALSGKQVQPGQPIVVQVDPNSPAQKAGLKPNDVILKVDEKDIATTHQLRNEVAMQPINKRIELEVLRDGRKTKVKVKIGKRNV